MNNMITAHTILGDITASRYTLVMLSMYLSDASEQNREDELLGLACECRQAAYDIYDALKIGDSYAK